MKKKVKQLDWFIFGPFIFLSLLGIIIIFSASAGFSGSPYTFLFKQFTFFIISLLIIFFFYFFGKLSWISSIRNNSIILLLVFLLLIFARISPPTAGTGAHGWINLYFLNIQPAELFKVSVILYLSALSAEKMRRRTKKRVFPLENTNSNEEKTLFGFRCSQLFFILLNLILIASMPDFGNFFIALFLILIVILSSGIKTRYILLIIALITIGYVLLPTLLKILPNSFLNGQYSLKRFLIFLNPWPYAHKESLQLIDSFYAISRGGLFGTGLGNSIEKMGYLPEPNTDFIMSVLIEELGTIWLIIIIGLILMMIGRIFYISFHLKNNFARISLFGIASYFFIQVLVNLGGIISVIPMTGVTFPFISYGGSSMLVNSISIGIICLISRDYRNRKIK